MRKKATAPAIIATTTIPPMTPPAIAPALDFFDGAGEPVVPPPFEPVDGVLAGVLVCEDALVLDTVPVGLATVAEDAGAEAIASAPATLNVSFVTTSRYAQAGKAVPDGICSGYWDAYTCEQLNCQLLHVSTVRF